MMKPILLRLSPLAMLLALTANAQTSGDELFNAGCANCHGGNGQGGQMAPSLINKVKTTDDAALAAFLRAGNPAKGMPPATVSQAEMPGLIDHLRQLARVAGDVPATALDTSNRFGSMPAIKEFVPVTDAILNNPSPSDWLWYSRTPDAQRFSPLNQINRNNVKSLGLAWSRGLPEGMTETIPTVYRGVMYLTMPGGSVAALDATTGDMIWHYQKNYGQGNGSGSARSKTLAIYEDMVYFTAPDEKVVALDARTGAVRWEAETPGRGNTTGAIVVKGKVISGGTCSSRETCYISAHDARTGKLAWKFYTAQAPDELPGFDTWAGTPLAQRRVSTWGLPGSFDAETGTLFWGVANPSPYTRFSRHNGNPDAIPETAPADLYSNSTLAIDPDTGKLKWYYQHLPGDDWDEDMNEERVIFKTKFNPDPKHVKWINPDIKKGEMRDVVVNVGEGGGLFVLDKHDGKFLWAMPFPSDVDNFILSDINVRTGATRINRKLVANKPGDENTVCFFNARSYWPTSYNPRNNSLYVPYINNCLKMRAGATNPRDGGAQPRNNAGGPPGGPQAANNNGANAGPRRPPQQNLPAGGSPFGQGESRVGVPLPGISNEELNGLAKVNMETGEITRWPIGPIPTNSSILVTAGDVVFWGDINRRFRAQDAETGKVLWETILGAPISTSNITYQVNGKQYIAILTGNNMSHPGLDTGTMGPMRLNLQNTTTSNAVYVFALPGQ